MSGLSQIVGTSAGQSNLLLVDSNGKIGVNDATAQSSLASIDTALGGTLSVGGLNLSSIDSALQGTLQVASASTLSVSAPAISTTSANLAAAQSVSDGATFTSASQDLNDVKDLAVFGSSTDTTAQIVVEVSANNSDFFVSEENPVYVNNGVYVRTMSSQVRYMRFKYTNSSGGTKTITMNVSYKK